MRARSRVSSRPVPASGLERTPNLWWFFFGTLPARFTRELIAGREDQAHWTGTEFLKKALEEPDPTAVKVIENLAVRDRLRSAVIREMEQYPVLMLPACGVAAFEHRQRRYQTDQKEIGLFEAMMPSTPFNFLGFPGMVIPFGVDSEGLPVGIQLVGRPYEDELLLELAIRAGRSARALPRPARLRRLKARTRALDYQICGTVLGEIDRPLIVADHIEKQTARHLEARQLHRRHMLAK